MKVAGLLYAIAISWATLMFRKRNPALRVTPYTQACGAPDRIAALREALGNKHRLRAGCSPALSFFIVKSRLS